MRTLVKAQCGAPANNRFFFDDFFGKDYLGYNSNGLVKTTPAVNVKEDSKQFVVEVAAPGLQKENFKVEINDGILIISAETKTEKTEGEETAKFTRKEFSYVSFKRSFSIDEDTIDTDNIGAKYENGVLNVTIPKKEVVPAENKAKTISIA